MQTKICTKCKNEKDIKDFNKNQYWCRDCQKIVKHAYDKSHKKEIKEYSINKRLDKNKYAKKYYINNKQLINHKNRLAYLKSDPYKNWANNSIKSHIRKKFIVNIDINYLIDLAHNTKSCPICKSELLFKIGNGLNINNSPTLDRINNESILNKDNIRIICHKCNATKLNRTENEMYIWCKQYINFMENKNV